MAQDTTQDKYTTINFLKVAAGIVLAWFLYLAWTEHRLFASIDTHGVTADARLKGNVEESVTRRLGPFGWTPFQFKTNRAVLVFNSYKGAEAEFSRQVSDEVAASLKAGKAVQVKYIAGNPVRARLASDSNPALQTLAGGLLVAGLLFAIGSIDHGKTRKMDASEGGG